MSGAEWTNSQSVVTVTLEPLAIEHVDEMWPLLADRAVYEFTGGEPPSRDALVERYRAQIAGSERSNERWHNWIVRRTDSGESIGFVQATVVDGTADIAWLVGVPHQGRGLAVRAVRAVRAKVDRLASSGVHTLTAHIHPEHARSQRVASAVNLVRTAELDEHGEEIWATTTR